MARPGNQHCANCIGTLSFPIHVEILVCLRQLWHYTIQVQILNSWHKDTAMTLPLEVREWLKKDDTTQ